MNTITISLSAGEIEELRKRGEQYGIATEELALAIIEQELAQSDEEFRRTVDYVLKKNEEFYRRLA